MICPNCRCEYREGFKYCVDCNVELVNELSLAEDNENQNTFSKRTKTKSNMKYYLLNGILGFIGGPLLVFFSIIAATQSQRLPPEWNEQCRTNTSSLFITLLFLVIIIAVNVIGIISFTKKYKSTGNNGTRLLKFILLNFTIFVSTFVVFILIGLVIFKF